MSSAAVHPSAYIGPDVELGDGVRVGALTVIDGETSIGAGSTIGAHCVLNEGEHGRLEIGAGSTLRSNTVVYGNTLLGDGFEAGHFSLVREGMRVGRDTRIGTYCELRGHSTIGDHCRFLANVHIPQYSQVGNFVWMFAYLLGTNDPHPPSDGFTRGPIIEDAAVITSWSSLLPGVRIGKMAFVAASSLVTKDVEAGMIVRGAPARVVGDIRDILLSDGRPAYPWWDHFRRGYPEGTEFPDAADVLEMLAANDTTNRRPPLSGFDT